MGASLARATSVRTAMGLGKRAALAALVALTACAGAGSPRGPDPDFESLRGVYSFRGQVANQLVSGMVELGDVITVTGNRGQCRTPISAARIQREQGGRGSRRLTVSCGFNLALQWDLQGNVISPAQASVQVGEERVTRGQCVRWGTAQPGQQAPCLDYERKVETVSRWVTGDVQVTKQ